MIASAETSQNEQIEERALLAATGRRRSRRSGSAGRGRPRSARRRSPATVARRRSSSAGRKPKSAASSVEASSASVVVVLAEDAALVDAVLEDVGLDLARPSPRQVAASSRSPRMSASLARAVQRDPAHQLRRDVVLRLAARLPDALVGLAPDRGRALGLRLRRSATAAAAAAGCAGCAAGSSRAPRRRRRSGAGRRRRCRSAPGARPS